MKRFAFSLAGVLDVRETQASIEQQKLATAAARVEAIEAELAQLHAERLATLQPQTETLMLAARERWLARIAAEEVRLRRDLAAAESAVEVQRQAFVEARRRVRLLELLRDRRLNLWRYEMNREIEEAAADAHRARSY